MAVPPFPHYALGRSGSGEKTRSARDGIDRRSCLTGCSRRMTAADSEAPKRALDKAPCGDLCGHGVTWKGVAEAKCLRGMVRPG
jgi:hypothetical protein